MWTARSLDWDSRGAIWALLGRRRRCRSLLLALELVNAAHEKKHNKGNYEKADDRIYKRAVVHSNLASLFSHIRRGIRPRDCSLFENQKEVGEINMTQRQTNRWHNNVINKRGDDGAKRC